MLSTAIAPDDREYILYSAATIMAITVTKPITDRTHSVVVAISPDTILFRAIARLVGFESFNR